MARLDFRQVSDDVENVTMEVTGRCIIKLVPSTEMMDVSFMQPQLLVSASNNEMLACEIMSSV
jgi:hypothetical protein